MLKIQIDVSQTVKALNALQRNQIPFATAYALTQTAKAAQLAVEKEVPRVFDRPTPFTQKPVYTKPATKKRLWSEVKIKDYAVKGNAAVKWLIAETRGGQRAIKGFEKLLQNANGRMSGGVMPRGWYAMPTSNAPMDQYGNVPGSAINRILSQLQASRDMGTRETAAAARRRGSAKFRGKSRPSRYFAVMPNTAASAHLVPGIWERVGFGFGSAVRPIFIYTARRPTYRKRLLFDEIVARTVNAEIEHQFARGIEQAMQTAK